MHIQSPRRLFLIALVLLLMAAPVYAQERRDGVLVNTEDAYDGYALLSPTIDPYVYLMDNEGRVIQTWTVDGVDGVSEAHLLENGNVIVAGLRLGIEGMPESGEIREYTWDNELVWEEQFGGVDARQHHAIDIMPNGNVLAILWGYYSLDEAAAMGLDAELIDNWFEEDPYLSPDKIVEIDRSTGEWVWQWNPWDHLTQDRDSALPNYGDIAEHRRRIDINYHFWFLWGADGIDGSDWMHTNSVHYNPDLDQVVLSVSRFDEIWVIDHGASTEETAGSAGDLLYRWGNPAAYQQGDPKADRQLFRQHDAQWIEAGLPGEGNILLFNNRVNPGTDDEYSSVMEVKLPVRADGSYDWEREAEVVWSYAPGGFHASFLSGAQRLPNGNTFITAGPQGQLIEVNAAGETVWEFMNPVRGTSPPSPDGIPNYALFRVHKYAADYPGFDGKDMRPGDSLVDIRARID